MIGIEQIGIALTGVVAIFLTQSKRESLRRYACIFGMLGQPFWFWAAIVARQWGVLFVSALYTLAWMKGIDQHWLRPLIKRRNAEKREATARVYWRGGLPYLKKFPPMPSAKAPRAE